MAGVVVGNLADPGLGGKSSTRSHRSRRNVGHLRHFESRAFSGKVFGWR
ncbi:hypothetical protein D779_2590 [Imhoffiella purpurea]|uniref:Uncharacterized protein n=1 Tax=Imhoffiella purpurea TaxID=1249627 RepID=W9V555_9GAMM|nr:hypothetical protein D779_2590 [Imhoffiella purpurea]